ncbi:hypothetical protein ERJ75_001734300 [Trypanosoma vivax]|nr:hypothetical protein ERJ75_001734300 [Trypanosoma vivax]
MGNATPTPKPLKASINDATAINATDRDPRLLVLASEANRIAKRMRTGPAWEQRMSIMRRFGEFTKERDPELSEGHGLLFIVGLNLAKSSAAQHTRAPLSLMAAGEATAQMFLSDLRRAAGANPTIQARPTMRWELGLVCGAMVSEMGHVAMRLAWVTAGRWGEIALLRKKELIGHPSDRNALIVDWGALPKTFEAGTRRAARVWRSRARMPSCRGLSKNGGWRAAHSARRARGGNNLAASRHDGAFYKTGRAGARGRGGGRTRFGPENFDTVWEARGSTGIAAPRRAVSGTLGRHFEQLREADGSHVEGARGMAKLPRAPPKAMGKDKAPRPLFNGRSFLRRTRITRAAAEKRQWRLSLQKANVGTLSLEWARRRLNNKALRRFGAVWCVVPQSPELHSSNHEPKLRINEADAKEMERTGVICEAPQKPTKGWAAAFAVVEENPAGLRRRPVALPKGENDHDECEAKAPPKHVSCYLGAAFGEFAAVSYLRAPLFQVSLPQGKCEGSLSRGSGQVGGDHAAPDGI